MRRGIPFINILAFVAVISIAVFFVAPQLALLKAPEGKCIFADPETELGVVTRVQTYDPPFTICGIKYLGKITFRSIDNDERYLAYVTPTSKCFNESGRILCPAVKKGWVMEYGFKRKIKKDPPPDSRITGLLEETQLKSIEVEGQ